MVGTSNTCKIQIIWYITSFQFAFLANGNMGVVSLQIGVHVTMSLTIKREKYRLGNKSSVFKSFINSIYQQFSFRLACSTCVFWAFNCMFLFLPTIFDLATVEGWGKEELFCQGCRCEVSCAQHPPSARALYQLSFKFQSKMAASKSWSVECSMLK